MIDTFIVEDEFGNELHFHVEKNEVTGMLLSISVGDPLTPMPQYIFLFSKADTYNFIKWFNKLNPGVVKWQTQKT